MELALFDVTWREIERIPLTSGTISVDRDLPGGGTYFFAVRSRGRIVQVGKVVVL
jgi:hypothetical protein